MQEVLPDAGSTCYKDILAVLAPHLVLVRPVFQLNDCGMIPFLPLFSRHFEYINKYINMQYICNIYMKYLYITMYTYSCKNDRGGNR